MKKINAVFFHDHYFYQDENNNFYSKGGLPQEIWGRYLEHFDTLTVVGRSAHRLLTNDEIPLYALSSRENVRFVLVDSVSGVFLWLKHKKRVKNIVSELIARNEVIIARLASELGLMAVKEAQKQEKTWAVELVGCPKDALKSFGGVKAKFYSHILYYRVRAALRQAQHALYVTKAFLQARYPARGPNLAACSNVQLTFEDTSIAGISRHKETGAKFILGFIGSLTGRHKGIDVAIEAVAALRVEGFDLQLRVLGSGDIDYWTQYAKNKGVEDRIFFDGTLPSGRKVYEWLDNVDIYIHPSYSEGLPRALLEAMSRGCPSIATRVGGIPELLRDEYLIKPGCYKSLASLIKKFIVNSDAMIRASNENFKSSMEYESRNLAKIRSIFWAQVKKSAISKQ